MSIIRVFLALLLVLGAVQVVAAQSFDVSVTYLLREVKGAPLGRVPVASAKVEHEARAALGALFSDPRFGTPSQGEKLTLTCKGSLKDPAEPDEALGKIRLAMAALSSVGTDTWALLNELRVQADLPAATGEVRISAYISPRSTQRPTAAEWTQLTTSLLGAFQTTAARHVKLRGLLFGLGSNTILMEVAGAPRSGQRNDEIEAAVRAALEAKLTHGFAVEKMKVAAE